MGELTLRQAPAGFEVFRKVIGLLDRGEKSVVNLLLVSSLGFGEGLLGLGFAILKEFLLC